MHIFLSLFENVSFFRIDMVFLDERFTRFASVFIGKENLPKSENLEIFFLFSFFAKLNTQKKTVNVTGSLPHAFSTYFHCLMLRFRSNCSGYFKPTQLL